jgi:hypothetical protein
MFSGTVTRLRTPGEPQLKSSVAFHCVQVSTVRITLQQVWATREKPKCSARARVGAVSAYRRALRRASAPVTFPPFGHHHLAAIMGTPNDIAKAFLDAYAAKYAGAWSAARPLAPARGAGVGRGAGLGQRVDTPFWLRDGL